MTMLSRPVFIYGIFHEGLCHYVGKTLDLVRRRREHLKYPSPVLRVFMENLKIRKGLFEMRVLEVVAKGTWRQKEKIWISLMKEANPLLLNIQQGGQGPVKDIWLTLDQRKRRSESAKKQWTPERRLLVSAQALAQWGARRAEMVERVKAAVSTESNRAKVSKGVKRSWDRNPERKIVQSETMKRNRVWEKCLKENTPHVPSQNL